MVSETEEKELVWMLYIVNSISLVCCLFIIIAYKAFHLQMFSFRLVVYIAITDLIHSVALMIPAETRISCLIQAFCIEYSSLSEILWTAIMAYSIYNAVIHLDPFVERKEKVFLVVGYVLPGILSFLPFFTDSYGQGLGWCWITNKSEEFVWKICLFYMFLVGIFVFNAVIYCVVYRKVSQEMKNSLLEEDDLRINSDLLTRLKFYPIILVVCYITVTIRRVYELIYPNQHEFWLVWLSGLTISLAGVLNSIVYGLSKEVKQKILECCKKKKKKMPFTVSNTSNFDQKSFFSTIN